MGVFWKTVRDNRRGWIGWIVALTAIAAMYASFYPSINNPAMADALNSFPQSLKEAFHLEDYTRPENYFAASVFGLLVPILVAVFAISAGVRVHGLALRPCSSTSGRCQLSRPPNLALILSSSRATVGSVSVCSV